MPKDEFLVIFLYPFELFAVAVKRTKVQCSIGSFFSPKTHKLDSQLHSPGPSCQYVHTVVL
jgi:hypothetical protein